MDNSFDLFESQRSDSRLKNDLASGKLGRLYSQSVLDKESRVSEHRQRNTMTVLPKGKKLSDVNEINFTNNRLGSNWKFQELECVEEEQRVSESTEHRG